PKPGKPLYKYTQGRPKALLEFRGKPLVQHVLDALGGAEQIERVVLVGLDESCGVSCAKPLAFVPNQGSMLENIRTGMEKVLELNPDAEYALIGVSDSPLLAAELLDWAVESALETRHDAYYYLLKRATFETRFPGSNRKYVSIKDMQVMGGSVGIMATRLVDNDDDIWGKLIAARKSAVKGAMLFGFSNLVKLLLRRITVAEAVAVFQDRVGIRGRAIFCPHAELAYDVDLDEEYEYLLQHPEAVG
ncbi:MAG: nucleotidyltransferase family protein, partial [Anaerolineae bacterium]|nr:nucleotidyltransferase family protein [Anaerolineae bacterium]